MRGTDAAPQSRRSDDELMALERERDRNRSLVDIYEHVGTGGVRVDRTESSRRDSSPRERIRSSEDTGPKAPVRQPHDT